MEHTEYTMLTDQFAGHLFVPRNRYRDIGIVVLTGGEREWLSPRSVAERFAECGLVSLSVSLYGARDQQRWISEIPLEMVERAVEVLIRKGCEQIGVYGYSIGAIIAVLAAQRIPRITRLVLVSPLHVNLGGLTDKWKKATGKSLATWRGKEIPYLELDCGRGSLKRYVYDQEAGRRVMRCWQACRDAYKDSQLEEAGMLRLDQTCARILLVYSMTDEQWDADYAAHRLVKTLLDHDFDREFKNLCFPEASHLLGVMPSRERNRKLFRWMPLLHGREFRNLRRDPKGCFMDMEQSEQVIIQWLQNR